MISNIALRIIQLYDLNTRGNVKKLSEKMGVSTVTVNNYKTCETPPQNLILQISKDFDGKEGRPLINWNWLFSGIEPMFKDTENLPEPPPIDKKEDKLDSILSKVGFLEEYVRNLEAKFKESEMRNRLITDGLGYQINALRESNPDLGKLKDDSKESTSLISYNPTGFKSAV